MQTVYIGNTLVNDIMLGAQRMDDVLQDLNLYIDWLLVGGGGGGAAVSVFCAAAIAAAVTRADRCCPGDA